MAGECNRGGDKLDEFCELFWLLGEPDERPTTSLVDDFDPK